MSQLLDALKKAAIEKQQREMTAGLSLSELHEIEKQHQVISKQKSLEVPESESDSEEDPVDVAEENQDVSEETLDLDVDFDELDEEVVAEPAVPETTQSTAEETNEMEANSEAKVESEGQPEFEAKDKRAADVDEQPVEHLDDGINAEDLPTQTEDAPADKQDKHERLKQSIVELSKITDQEDKKRTKRRLVGLGVFILIVAAFLAVFYYLMFHATEQLSTTASPKSVAMEPVEINRFLAIIEEQESASETQTDTLVSDQSVSHEKPSEVKAPVAAPSATDSMPEPTPDPEEIKPAQPKRTKPTAPPKAVEDSQTPARQNKVQPVPSMTTRLLEAYDAFNAGRLEQAEDLYQSVLTVDTDNVDAQLGLAALDYQRALYTSALSRYQSILDKDPENLHAQEGLLGIAAQAPINAQYEARLAELNRRFPDAAHLRYISGVVHARKQEWSSALSAFSQAWQKDRNNPDYLYNMAVSLDQLGRYGQALQTYHSALRLAKTRQAVFNHAWVLRRVEQLEGIQK